VVDSRKYQQLKDNGTCVQCSGADAEPGRLRCARCRKKHADKAAARRKQARKRKQCEVCSKPAAKGRGRRCNDCADKYLRIMNERRQALQLERVAAGLCVGCGKQPPLVDVLGRSRRRCIPCLQHQRVLRRLSASDAAALDHALQQVADQQRDTQPPTA